MIITTDYVDVPVDDRSMRTFVAAPKGPASIRVSFATQIFFNSPARCCVRAPRWRDMVLLWPPRKSIIGLNRPD